MAINRQWKWWLARIGAACIVGWTLAGHAPALADTPAITDFGEAAVYAYQSDTANASHYAMFLTLYEDGHKEVIVRPIADDAVVGFHSDHGAWQLNHPLMWFLNMPVYVKQVPDGAMAEAI